MREAREAEETTSHVDHERGVPRWWGGFTVSQIPLFPHLHPKGLALLQPGNEFHFFFFPVVGATEIGSRGKRVRKQVKVRGWRKMIDPERERERETSFCPGRVDDHQA
jgi:hypothetical protein